MTTPDLDTLAKERVARRLKEPQHDPSSAAMVAGVLTATGLTIFFAFAGLNGPDFNGASLILVLLAAGLAYLHHRRAGNRYWDELRRERARLEAEYRER